MELIIILSAAVLFIVCFVMLHHLSRSKRVLTEALAANATRTAELQKRLEDLEEKFNDFENMNLEFTEIEKRWQDGIQNIMDYSMDKAMRGIMNG